MYFEIYPLKSVIRRYIKLTVQITTDTNFLHQKICVNPIWLTFTIIHNHGWALFLFFFFGESWVIDIRTPLDTVATL